MTPQSDVAEFMEGIEDGRQRDDSRTLVDMMETVTGEPPKLWGNIIGFGDYHYEYASGRQGDTFRIGFSPRKKNLTLYLMDYVDAHDPLLAKLGRHTTGKACLYIKRLDQVDSEVLASLLKRSWTARPDSPPS